MLHPIIFRIIFAYTYSIVLSCSWTLLSMLHCILKVICHCGGSLHWVMTDTQRKSHLMESWNYPGCHLLWKTCALRFVTDSKLHTSPVISVRSTQNIIHSQFTSWRPRNKWINLSNEINCSTVSVYVDYCCIYTMIKPRELLHLWLTVDDVLTLSHPESSNCN